MRKWKKKKKVEEENGRKCDQKREGKKIRGLKEAGEVDRGEKVVGDAMEGSTANRGVRKVRYKKSDVRLRGQRYRHQRYIIY